MPSRIRPQPILFRPVAVAALSCAYAFGIARAEESWHSIAIDNWIHIRDVAISHVDSNRAFAWSGILYRSTNGGAQWELVPARFEGFETNPELENLVFDPTDIDGGWTMVGSRVLRTTDFGLTWMRWGNATPGEIGSLAVDPVAADAALVGTIGGSGRGVHHTTNAGVTWTRLGNAFVVDVHSIAPNPSNAAVLVAGTPQGIARSTNAGTTWNQVSAGDAATDVRWSANGTVVRALQNGLRASTDGGATWPAPAAPADQATAFTFDSLDPSFVAMVPNGIYGFLSGSWFCSLSGYAGTISRSTSGGSSWNEPWYPPIMPQYEPVVRSTNSGVGWTAIVEGMAEAPIEVVQVGAAGDVYVADLGLSLPSVEELDLKHSVDGLNDWKSPSIMSLASQGVFAVDVHSFLVGQGALIGHNEGCDIGGHPFIAKFTNGGEDWIPEDGWWNWGRPAPSLSDLSAKGDGATTLFSGYGFSAALAFSHGSGEAFTGWVWDYDGDAEAMIVARTTDGGETFEWAEATWMTFHPLQAIVTPESDEVLFALADEGEPVQRSTDGGLHWEARSTGLPNERAVRIRMSPTDGEHILVAFERGLPWVTHDGGSSWARLDADSRWTQRTPTREERPVLPAMELRNTAVHDADWDLGTDPPRVFLATDRGVWVSNEGFVNDGLPLIPLHRVAYSPVSATLFAASSTFGAFWLPLPHRPGDATPTLGTQANAFGSPAHPLLLAAPNPFARTTSARVELPSSSLVVLRVYDAAGRRVRTLARERLSAGSHTFEWDSRDETGRSVAPGAYFLRIETDTASSTRRLVRLR